MQIFKFASIQVMKYDCMQECKYNCMQVGKVESIKIYNYESMKVCSHIQLYKYASIHVYKYVSMHVCNYSYIFVFLIPKPTFKGWSKCKPSKTTFENFVHDQKNSHDCGCVRWAPQTHPFILVFRCPSVPMSRYSGVPVS